METTDHYVLNINEIKKLVKEIRTIDLLNPTSHTIMLVGGIIDRCKRLPELEIVDFSSNKVNIDNIEADA